MKKLKHHWNYEKILTSGEAIKISNKLRKDNKIVSLNGSFDLLHAGHLDILAEAKMQGDILFVGINSDASVKEGKGDKRPYIGELERAALLAGLDCVDFVIVIDAPYNSVQDVLLDIVRPNIHVNGKDYGEVEKWIEWPKMKELGIQGYSVDIRPGLSTSNLVEKIKQ